MDQETITIDEALKILELTSVENLDDVALQKIQRRARRRWHPDTIAYLKPDPKTIAEYERNFRLIDLAIECVRAFLGGNVEVGSSTARGFDQFVAEEPEEVIRRNAPEIQEVLRKVWTRVKENAYKMTEEVITLREGVPYKDLLMDDLKEDVPVLAVSALVNGWVLLLIATIATLPVAALGEAVWSAAIVIVMVLWALQAFSCVITFLPLSRFWLPEPVSQWVSRFVDAGLYVNRYVAEHNLDQHLAIALLVGIPIRIAQAVKWLVLLPLYKLSGVLLGDRRMGTIRHHVRYYAGLAEWYVDELLRAEPSAMDREQLFHLSHLYAELKDAPIGGVRGTVTPGAQEADYQAARTKPRDTGVATAAMEAVTHVKRYLAKLALAKFAVGGAAVAVIAFSIIYGVRQFGSAGGSPDLVSVDPKRTVQQDVPVVAGDHIDTLLSAGRSCLDSGDTVCARSKAEAILTISPRHSEAERMLTEVIQVERRKWVSAAIEIGGRCLAANDLECAKRRANEALGYEPRNPAASDLLKQVEKRGRHAEVSEKLARARECLARQDPECATFGSEDALRMDPQNVAAQEIKRQAMAMASSQSSSMGLDRTANEQTTNGAAEQIIRLVDSNLKEGRACMESKRFECAVAKAENVLQIEPANRSAQALLHEARQAQRMAFEESELK